MTERLKVSKQVQNSTPSLTLALAEKASELTAQGKDVVRFGTGEPDFRTPEYIGDAGKKAIDDGYTKYDAVKGVKELREAICEKLKTENHLDYTLDDIIVTSGAKSALSVALDTLCDPGDEVIIPKPYWVSYAEMVKFAGAVPVIIDTDPARHFKMTADEFEAAITDKTKALMLNTPVNPTGQIYSEDELRAIADVAVKHDIVVISDEIYESFVYDDAKKPVSIATFSQDIKDRTIVVNGFSKTFSMTGWRLGWAAGPRWLIDGMSTIQGHTISHPCTIAQHAGITALRDRAGRVAPMIAEYAKRREAMVNRLEKLPVRFLPPDGTFYIFVDVRPILDDPDNDITTAYDFSMRLLADEYVVTIPGEAFNAPGFVRFAYTVGVDVINKGFDRIEAFIKAINE